MTGPVASVRIRVPAKVNLYLSVGDLRDDGYHDLVTVFHAVDLCDDVTVTTADRLSVRTLGVTGVPTGAKNLAGAAAKLFGRKLGRTGSVAVEITKRIPVAGGMAGGSADAAATLLACASLWGLDLTRDELAEIGAELGSDVPFALTGGTAVGTGRGERLSPVLSRMHLHWVLALAQEGLSTPDVYAELDRLRSVGSPRRVGELSEVLSALASGDPSVVADSLGNDLQAAAISLLPNLRETLRAGVGAGALAGIVSGSGPTVAFLCSSTDSAAEVAAELAGSGTCRAVRMASGPAPGARLVGPGRP